MVTIGEGRGKEIVREFGMDMYTLLYLKWITEQDPDGMRGEFGGEWIEVYVWLSHSTVYLKLSQLC